MGKLQSLLRVKFALFGVVLLLYFPALIKPEEHTRTETNVRPGEYMYMYN